MLYMMFGFSLLGGIDKLLGNKFGLGVKFDEGIKAMGSLALTIIGIYSLSPIIAKLMTPILTPMAKLLFTDPSVFISSVLATDLGAFNTSMELALDPQVGVFNGIILASMLGATISFTVPVAINLISANDFIFFSKGVLAGIITIPVGMLVAGFMLHVELIDIIFNILPVVIISSLIAYGLVKSLNKTIQVFNILGKVVLFISTIGFLFGILNYGFGISIIDGMLPIEDGVMLVFSISVVLSGAYPMLYIISRKFYKELNAISNKYGLDEYSLLGLVSSLASALPMMGIYSEMNNKGKVLNAAFAVSGSYVFGGQLGYVSSVAPHTVNAFIVSKLVAAIAGIAVALYLIKKETKEVM
ncbi:MAG: ethanolamine utilization protein EutH [Gudongella sp.]|nr:ethanolamine utilization protein EutH [Gudongella sp.]